MRAMRGLGVLGVLLAVGGAAANGGARGAGEGEVGLYLPLVRVGLAAPVLKWQLGGCFSWGCERGWYASAAVANLDGDPQPEVIGAAYSVFAVDGATGALEWRHDPPGGRAWPSVAVADLDGDGRLEIVTAHGDGWWHVWDVTGDLERSQQPTPGSELRSLAVADLDADGTLEVVVAATRSTDQWFVFEHDGGLRAGQWPQHHDDNVNNGFASGAYNQNIGVGDVDDDGRGEIIGPNDTHYIAAFHDDGSPLMANPLYAFTQGTHPHPWARVGVHVDHYVDLRGYANCGVEHRPNWAHSAPALADLDGNGSLEIAVVGNVYNCGTSPYQSLYHALFIFNGDRTRWAASGFDWTTIPLPDSAAAPLSEDYNVIENAQPNPAVADLDGDGLMEILYASYDGRLHAYWLDGTEHGAWPYEVYNPAEGVFRFASEPAIADLDGDGLAEVIFATWPQKGSGQGGRLVIASADGSRIAEAAIPGAAGADWSGALAAPTLADIDGDPDLEVVLNTTHAGLVAYDLPRTAGAVVLWGTSRGGYWRSGGP